ncbi:MAG: hypothetical protein ACRDTO_00550 [Mycobacterium sp.]
MHTPTTSSGANGVRAKRTYAAAARFTVVDIAVALVVLGLALWWVNGCRSGHGDNALAGLRGAASVISWRSVRR